MERKLVIGALRRTARSDFDSRTLSAYGEATCDLPMNGWRLQPLAGLSLGRSKAGFDAGSLRLEPRRVWAHEFGDLNTPMTAQFQGAASASPFQISAAALKRDTLILGLGASGEIGKGLTLFADLQVEHNARQRNLAVLVGLRSRW